MNRPAVPADPRKPPGGCLGAEELAAFIDRRLAGAERARVVEHLASCERCYAVFSGVHDFLEEQEEDEEEPAAGPRPFPTAVLRWSSPRLWAAAAAVVLAAGIVGWVVSLWFPGWGSAAELVAALEAPPTALAGHRWQERVTRSPVSPDLPSRQVAFLLGALQVDLRVALEADDAAAAQEVLAAILRTIDGTLFVEDSAGADLYRRAQRDLGGAARPGDLLRPMAAAEQEIRELGYLSEADLALGQWTETARLAAATGDGEYLGQRRTRRRLARLLGRAEEEFPDPFVLEELRTVQATLGRGEVTPEDLGDLARRLGGLVDAQAR